MEVYISVAATRKTGQWILKVEMFGELTQTCAIVQVNFFAPGSPSDNYLVTILKKLDTLFKYFLNIFLRTIHESFSALNTFLSNLRHMSAYRLKNPFKFRITSILRFQNKVLMHLLQKFICLLVCKLIVARHLPQLFDMRGQVSRHDFLLFKQLAHTHLHVLHRQSRRLLVPQKPAHLLVKLDHCSLDFHLGVGFTETALEFAHDVFLQLLHIFDES